MAQLRFYKQQDEEKVKKVVSTCLREFGLIPNFEETDSDLCNIEDIYIKKGGTFRILEDSNGKIIGNYGLFKVNESTCELRKMYLLKEKRGKGYGSLMMKDSLKLAKDLNFKTMVLETHSSLKRAGQMYEKYGLKRYRPEHQHASTDRADCFMKLEL